MGKLNEIQEQTTQSYGSNSFTTKIKENTVVFDSTKDSFTFLDPIDVNALSISGENIDLQIPYPISKVGDFVYEIECDNLDYIGAKKYFETSDEQIQIGACSSVQKGNLYGRNYDWIYNNSVDFIVKTPNKVGRFSTVGFGGFSSKLTKTFVESGKYSNEYKIVPFRIVDGINEKGVVVNTNVVPRQKGITSGTVPAVETKETICNMMLPRYILDNFETATQAVEYIRDYVSIFNYGKLGELFDYDLHIMVGDAEKTYIIEFVENETVILDVSSKGFMTNFHLYGVTFNNDGSVFTPLDKSTDESKDPMTVNGIESFGSGLERYNLINSNYSSIADESDMIDLMKELKYTYAYSSETDPRWYTECVGHYESGDITVSSSIERFEEAFDKLQEMFAQRDRDTGQTWQTVHSCIYDINNKTVKVFFQEENAYKEYSVAQEIKELGGVLFKAENNELKVSLDGGDTWKTVTIS